MFLNSVQRGILVSRSIAVERVPSIGKTTFCLGAILTSHLTMSDWRWGHQIMPIFYYFRCFTQCKVVLYFNGWSFDKWCLCWSYYRLFWLQHFSFPNWNTFFPFSNWIVFLFRLIAVIERRHSVIRQSNWITIKIKRSNF